MVNKGIVLIQYHPENDLLHKKKANHKKNKTHQFDLRQGLMGFNGAKVQKKLTYANFLAKKCKKDAKKMKFVDFEYILSQERIGRYLKACNRINSL